MVPTLCGFTRTFERHTSYYSKWSLTLKNVAYIICFQQKENEIQSYINSDLSFFHWNTNVYRQYTCIRVSKRMHQNNSNMMKFEYGFC